MTNPELLTTAALGAVLSAAEDATSRANQAVADTEQTQIGANLARDEALSAADVTRYATTAARNADLANRTNGDWAMTAEDGDVVYHVKSGGTWIQAGPRIQAKEKRVINAEIALAADGVADDGPALQAYFNLYAGGTPGRALGKKLLPGTYYSSIPLKLKRPDYQTWDFSGVVIVFALGLTGVLFEIGDSVVGTTVLDSNIQAPKITRKMPAGDFISVPARGTSEAVIGLRAVNLYHCILSDIDVSYCSVGFDPYGSAGRGNAYNVYRIRNMFNCRVSMRPGVGSGTGWSNENLFEGGRWWNNWGSSTTAALTAASTVIPVTATYPFAVGQQVRVNAGQGGDFGASALLTVTAVDAIAKTITVDPAVGIAIASGKPVAQNMCESHAIFPDGFSCNRNYMLKPSFEGYGQNAARMHASANVIESPRTEMYNTGGVSAGLDGEHASVTTFYPHSISVNPSSTGNRATLDYWGGSVGYYASANPVKGGGNRFRSPSNIREELTLVSDLVPGTLPQRILSRNSAITQDTPADVVEDTATSGAPHGRQYRFVTLLGTSESVVTTAKTRALYRREHFGTTHIDYYGGESGDRVGMFSPNTSTPPATRYRASGTADPLVTGDMFTGADGARRVWNSIRWTQRATQPFELQVYANASLPDATSTPWGLARQAAPAAGKPPLAYSNGTSWLDFPGVITGTQLINPASIPANSSATLTIALAGAVVGDAASVAPSADIEAGLIWTPGAVYTAGVVSFRLLNHTAAAIGPAAQTWRATISRAGAVVI